MVETYIVKHRDFRREQRDRAIAFIDFANKDFALPDPSAGKWRIIGNEVFHHRAVHDRGIKASVRQNPANHSGDSRLAAGPANRNAARGGVEQVGQQFGARHAGATKCVGFGDIWHAVLDSRRGNENLIAADYAAAVLRKQIDAQALQPCELRC